MLAIAGLVLAIVFIAVPALQRNSRNTQRRSDLANLRAQVDTWVSNNGGKIPSTQDHLDSIVGSTGWGHYNGNGAEPAAVAQVTAGTIGTSTNETITMFTDTVTNANMDASALPNRQAIHIWLERKCRDGIMGNGNDVDTAGTNFYVNTTDLEASTSRAIAYVYQIEGEDNARCEDNI